MITPGTRVRYYQPGVDGILSSWAGKRVRVRGDDGEVKTATVTEVVPEGGVTYYHTQEGVLLSDSDLRGVVE